MSCVHDSVELEARGLPIATLVTAAFERLAHRAAAGRAMPQLPIIVLPYPLDPLPSEVVRRVARDHIRSFANALVQTPGSLQVS